ncbi:MAG: HAMP domain-containing protein, partial [Eubacteriales bacterium]|nr:HAMP domain-containing protein [Eubacteriales bacterium]
MSRKNNNEKLKNDATIPFFRSMRGRLGIWFLLLSLIPLIGTSVLAYVNSRNALQKAGTDKLRTVLDIRKNRLEKYLEQLRQDVSSLADTIGVLNERAFDNLTGIRELKKYEILRRFRNFEREAKAVASYPWVSRNMADLSAEFQNLGPERAKSMRPGKNLPSKAGGGNKFAAAYQEFDDLFSGQTDIYGYENALLIDPAGNVVFSANNEKVFGVDLNSETYKESGLGKLFQSLREAPKGRVGIADFSTFEGKAAMFIGAPIFDGDRLAGILAFHVTSVRINAIMNERTGMLKTAESYIVGPDKRMRSNSFLDPSGRSVEASFAGTMEKNGVDTQAVREALDGKSGNLLIKNYLGKHVLSSFSPLHFNELNWAVIVEVDVTDAFAPQAETDGEENDFFSLFAKGHGYQDLMLILSDGFVFYTTARAADLNTNILTGPFKETHLAELVRKILKTQKPAITDLAPYPPSNNKPRGFAAAPVVCEGGTHVIVASQIPLERINEIMQGRAGMGEIADAYLAGPDKRMRSDSFLDPSARSVEASFAGTVEENGVDTRAVREALNGNSGVESIADYRGNRVLSAFAPVRDADVKWAFIAELREDEAFAPVYRLRNTAVIFGVVIAAAVIVLAIWISGSLARPVVMITNASKSVANGNLNTDVNIESTGETGMLAQAFNSMTQSLRELASQMKGATSNITSMTAEILATTSQQAATASQQAAAVNETTSTVEEVRQTAEQSSERAKSVSDMAQEATSVANQGLSSVAETVEAMNRVKAQVENIAENILMLSEQTQQIGEIIST